MSRPRLTARLGDVRPLGHGLLADHRHAFAVLGSDGTGKGAIVEQGGERVQGVAYQLTAAQFAVLDRYEGEYQRRRVSIAVGGAVEVAQTYYPLVWRDGLRPAAWYVEHYLAGMREHGFPADYVEAIRAQAAGVLPRPTRGS